MWTSGYVTEIGYAHGFYRELTPALHRFVTLAKAKVHRAGAKTYCELGCGQGFSANLIAAANPQLDIHATDFNPDQIAGARLLAEAAGTPNVTFHDTDFAGFADQPGLPDQFDTIALHGVYSWINDENRRAIVDFITRKLAVGGIVYISYNALPGWAAAMPMRRLFVDHASRTSEPLAARIEQAIAFAENVSEHAQYFTAVPGLKEKLKTLKKEPSSYLAHEYFNRDWTPFYVADVADDMARAKLSFVGSAHLLDHVDAVNMTPQQAGLLSDETDPIRRESLRDYLINQQFRRDIFMKGTVPHTVLSLRQAWLESRFALSVDRAEVKLTATGPLGEATLQEAVYAPVLDSLTDGPRTLADILASNGAVAKLDWQRLMRTLVVLVGTGNVEPCLPAEGESARRKQTQAFNCAVCDRARASGELEFLASPVTGGGVAVSRFDQLFLAEHEKQADDPLCAVWAMFKEQGQSVVKDGTLLQTDDENLEELKAKYASFTGKRLPMLRQLGIA